MKQRCTIREKLEETRHLSIYINGSEGIEICHFCEMMVVNFLQRLMDFESRIKMNFYKKVK